MKWTHEHGATVANPDQFTRYIIAGNTLTVMYTEVEELKSEALGISGRLEVLKKRAEQHKRYKKKVSKIEYEMLCHQVNEDFEKDKTPEQIAQHNREFKKLFDEVFNGVQEEKQ